MFVSHRSSGTIGPAVVLLFSLLVLFVGFPVGIPAQETILEIGFEEESDLDNFWAPRGNAAVALCGQDIPNGTIEIDGGELLMTNDPALGLAMISLDPEAVGDLFPDDTRDYRLQVLVNLDSVNELLVYLRGRVGVDRVAQQFDSTHERGYAFVILPSGVSPDPDTFDGAIGIAEFTGCHTTVPHPNWPRPRGGDVGFASVSPGFAVIPGDWYWLEISAQGADEGGPVLMSMSFWPEDEDRPDEPQLSVVDVNGLEHDANTLDPANNIEVLLGTSFDFGQLPGATARFDELTITTIGGCAVPPASITRELWEGRLNVEGAPTGLFEDGGSYQVTINISDIRSAGVCEAASSVTITETAPGGWEIESASAGGEVLGDNVVRWTVDLAGAGEDIALTYEVAAIGDARAVFSGEFNEPDSGFEFALLGDAVAVSAETVPPVSDFGSIQQWLVLGPFSREIEGADPPVEELIRDYLTDGDVTDADVQPRAGDTIRPDYGGDAASTGLTADSFGRNPGGVPTWVEWLTVDDDDDLVDFNSVYGDVDEVMCYAVTYLVVEEDIEVNFGVSSDDSVHILLDGETIHVNQASRGAEDRVYQDTPFTHEGLGGILLTEGCHVLTVKVFEGSGGHNFRVGFLDKNGIEIPEGPEEIAVTLAPAGACGVPREVFQRGDADGSGSLDLTDGIGVLNFLFLGGSAPACLDSGDTDDNGRIELSDAIGVFGFLFLGAAPPAPPGPTECGVDPSDDDLDCAEYENCP